MLGGLTLLLLKPILLTYIPHVSFDKNYDRALCIGKTYPLIIFRSLFKTQCNIRLL